MTGLMADLIGRWDFLNCLLLSCLAKADGEHGWARRPVLGLQSDEPAAPMSPSTLGWARVEVPFYSVLGSRVAPALVGPPPCASRKGLEEGAGLQQGMEGGLLSAEGPSRSDLS